jgi:hypothetical protein
MAGDQLAGVRRLHHPQELVGLQPQKVGIGLGTVVKAELAG